MGSALISFRHTSSPCGVIKPLGEDSTPETVKPLRVSLVEPVACLLSHWPNTASNELHSDLEDTAGARGLWWARVPFKQRTEPISRSQGMSSVALRLGVSPTGMR